MGLVAVAVAASAVAGSAVASWLCNRWTRRTAEAEMVLNLIVFLNKIMCEKQCTYHGYSMRSVSFAAWLEPVIGELPLQQSELNRAIVCFDCYDVC